MSTASRESETAGAIAVRVGQVWRLDKDGAGDATFKVCSMGEDGALMLAGPGSRRSARAMYADELVDQGELVQDVAERAATKRTVDAFRQAVARAADPNKKLRLRMRPAPSPYPWRAVVLGVDAAKRSGWAIMSAGVLLESGEANKDRDAELLRVCGVALMHAEKRCVPCVLVLERPPNRVHPGRQASVLIGLGAARQAWEMAWRTQGGVRRRVVHVLPVTWRGALGIVNQASKGGLSTAEHERERAYGHTRKRALTARPAWITTEFGADEAAAICIAEWGSRAGETGAVLPEKLRHVAQRPSAERTDVSP